MRIPRNLQPGEKIWFRYYNTPERKHYGPIRTGEVIKVILPDFFGSACGILINRSLGDGPQSTTVIKPNEYRGRVK